MAFIFESLKIRHLAPDLAEEIDEPAKSFPGHEPYSLSGQKRRAANSVSLHIVEASTGLTNAEFRRFLVMANRSALDVAGCLFLAGRRKYPDEEKFGLLDNKIEVW
jgi:four helix bundle protein